MHSTGEPSHADSLDKIPKVVPKLGWSQIGLTFTENYLKHPFISCKNYLKHLYTHRELPKTLRCAWSKKKNTLT